MFLSILMDLYLILVALRSVMAVFLIQDHLLNSHGFTGTSGILQDAADVEGILDGSFYQIMLDLQALLPILLVLNLLFTLKVLFIA